MIRRLASLHWLQGGQVRQFQRYYQDAMTSCCPSRRTSFPSLGDTSVALDVSLPGGRVHRLGLELVARCLRPGSCRGDSRISQVPGEPQCSVCHVPNRRRQDCLHQTITVQQRGPWSSKGRGSHNWVFRRSIAWLSDSLFTLRRDRYLTRCKTRFQLLVKLYWTGFAPARFR